MIISGIVLRATQGFARHQTEAATSGFQPKTLEVTLHVLVSIEYPVLVPPPVLLAPCNAAQCEPLGDCWYQSKGSQVTPCQWPHPLLLPRSLRGEAGFSQLLA